MKFIKFTIATIAALLVWFISLEIIWLIVGAIGEIPIIGPILYLGNISWAQNVLASTSSVFIGSYCSVKICESAKVFCLFLIVIFGIFLLNFLINLSTYWDGYLQCGLIIISCLICYNSQKESFN